MSKYDDTKITRTDILVISLFTVICFAFAHIFTDPKEVIQPVPPEYTLMCEKVFDMPSKFNIVLGCMHIRKEGN